jgi:hypothetical protein
MRGFPERLKRPFGWSNHIPEPKPSANDSPHQLFPFFLSLRAIPVTRASGFTARNYEGRSAQE